MKEWGIARDITNYSYDDMKHFFLERNISLIAVSDSPYGIDGTALIDTATKYIYVILESNNNLYLALENEKRRK